MQAPTYEVKALDESTWPAFAALVEANNGIFGGCWCMGFHSEDANVDLSVPKRDRKLSRVRAGTTHAALVFSDDNCPGWAQFGTPEELLKIKNRAAYERDRATTPRTGGLPAVLLARATDGKVCLLQPWRGL